MAIDDNASYELTGYQVKDLAGKVRAKADSSSLASVATSGLYSDLVGAPTIPTVYNGTLTIQQNGTTLGTFSANQSSNETINITGGGSSSLIVAVSFDNPSSGQFSSVEDFDTIQDAYGDGEVVALLGGGTHTVSGVDNGRYIIYAEDGDLGRLELTFNGLNATTGTYKKIDFQEKLIAGTNISIAADGKTISAAGGSGATYFYTDSPYFKIEGGSPFHFYKDAALTTIATNADFMNAITGGGLYLSLAGEPEVWAVGFAEVPEGSTWDPTEELWFEIRSSDYYYVYRCDSSNYCVCELIRRFQRKLTAGSNITIAGDRISATDTTYSAFTGATSSVAGSAGLVPAPTTSDVDKYLKGDGTWATAGANVLHGSIGLSYIPDQTPHYQFASSLSYNAIVAADGAFLEEANDGAVYQVIGFEEELYTGQAVVWITADGENIIKLTFDSTYINGEWSKFIAQGQLTAGSNITISGDNTISATDTTYPNFTGATSSVAGTAGLVPAPAAGDETKALHGDGTWKDTTAKLVEMSYGEANAWTKFINAYNAGSIVYCRASSNANPASGSQTRKAFMAYVNNAASPTSVEFQYVRSVSSKTEAQPVDQVFVYTLTNTNGGTWSVASRNMGPKIAAGTGINVSYSNGTYTISLAS